MLVRFTKGSVAAKNDALVCERPDGTSSTAAMPKQGILPHDAFHFVVETTLGWTDAFFGQVAAGASLADTTARFHPVKKSPAPPPRHRQKTKNHHPGPSARSGPTPSTATASSPTTRAPSCSKPAPRPRRSSRTLLISPPAAARALRRRRSPPLISPACASPSANSAPPGARSTPANPSNARSDPKPELPDAYG